MSFQLQFQLSYYAFLYPSCYPWRNCYFGRKCYVVEIWFCVDWQSVVTPGSLLWLLNTTLNLITLFALVLHVYIRTVLALFFWISLVCVIRLFVSFCIIVCALSCILLFMLHSFVLNWWWWWWWRWLSITQYSVPVPYVAEACRRVASTSG